MCHIYEFNAKEIVINTQTIELFNNELQPKIKQRERGVSQIQPAIHKKFDQNYINKNNRFEKWYSIF